MNKPVLFSLTLTALAAGTSGPVSAQNASEKTDKRPNIILFMVDDMGWQDTSLPFWTEKTYYNSVYETPNMERLAKQGMMFTQAYACPLSSATRCKQDDRSEQRNRAIAGLELQRGLAGARYEQYLCGDFFR